MRNEMRVGIATINITPPVGIPLLGYHRSSPSTGVLDSLMASALVFELNNDKVVLLSVELLGMTVEHTNRLRQRIADTIDIPPQQVMITFTHTHSGPDTVDGHPLQTAYRSELGDKLVQIAVEASEALHLCEISWGVTTAEIGENRRKIKADGQAEIGRNWDGTIDNRVGILKIIDSDSGDNIAVVVICTAHANILKGDNLRISGDYPGRTREMLSRMVGCPVMVLMGSAGDINPRTRMWRDDNPMFNLDMIAQTISDAVLNALPDTKSQLDWRFMISSDTIDVPMMDLPTLSDAQSLAETVAQEWGIDTKGWLETVSAYIQGGNKQLSLPVEVQVLVIGDGIIAGIPMEPFSQLALDLNKRFNPYSQSHGSYVFLNGYTNGLLGYLPTADQYQYGGYEVDWMPVVYGSRTGLLMPVVPETGEMVLNTVEQLIDQPINILLDLPDQIPANAKPFTLKSAVTTSHKSKRQTSDLGKSAFVNFMIEPITHSAPIEFEWQVKSTIVSHQYLPAVIRGIQSRLVVWATEYGEAIQNIKISVIDGQEHLVDSGDTAFQIAAHRAMEEALEQAELIPLK